MARNNINLTEEEKKRRILLVSDYMIETKSSTRKTAQFISANHFPISNATVHDYVNRLLPKIDVERYLKVQDILKKHTPQSVDVAQTRVRVYSAAMHLLNDYTIPEIAEMLDSTYDTIYDDITSRLPKLDPKIARDVKRKLAEHRLSNLPQYQEEIPEHIINENLHKNNSIRK